MLRGQSGVPLIPDLRGRQICQARIDGDDLIVVCIEIPQGVLVVTAYWKGI